MRKKISTYLSLLLIVLVCFTIDDGHEWGDDFALYLSMAKSLVACNPQTVAVDNAWMMQHSSGLIGPDLYPWGYPVFLSVFTLFSGNSFVIAKIFQWLFLAILGLFLSHRIIRYSGFSRNQSSYWFLFLLMLFHPKLLLFANRFNSDLFFLVLVYAYWFVFYARQSADNIKTRSLYTWALGLIIFSATQTRDVGLFLAFPLGVECWRQFSNSKSSSLFGLLILVASVSPYVFSHFNSESTHVQAIDLSLFSSLLPVYIEMVGFYPFVLIKQADFVFIHWIGLLIGSVLFILFFVKAKTIYRLYLAEASWVIPNFLLLIFWPSNQGDRFLFPWIWMFLLLIVRVYSSTEVFKKRKYVQVLFPALAVLLLTQSIASIAFHTVKSSNEIGSITTREMLSFIRNKTDRDEVVYFVKPRLMYYFTKRRAIYSQYEADMYRVMSTSDWVVKQKKPIQGVAFSKMEIEHEQVFENESYVIYRILN